MLFQEQIKVLVGPLMIFESDYLSKQSAGQGSARLQFFLPLLPPY